MSWFRIIGAVSTTILIAVILYGGYQYYFTKPIPIVNNYTVAAGANLNQTQNEAKSSSGPSVGLVAGPLMLGSEIGGFIGGMVSFKF